MTRGGSLVVAVRTASTHELVAVQGVALAAGGRFAEVDDPRIARHAADPPPALDELAAAVAADRLMVAVLDGVGGAAGQVVGFLLWDVLDGRGHVEEVSVDPSFQGRSVGTALLAALADRADDEGLDGVTLTTFRDVPWNRPYYERRGYRVLDADELTPALVAKVADEAAFGLASELRVAMWRPSSAGGR